MSEVNYYTPNSDVTWTVGSGPVFNEQHRNWRPGFAGPFERVAMGAAQGDGWFVYFVQHVVVLEVWVGGEWQFTRTLDLRALRKIPAPVLNRMRHVVGFGFDLDAGTVSLAVNSRSLDDRQDSVTVYGTWQVANLAQVLAHPPRVHLGGMPVRLAGGETQYRTLDGDVLPIRGRFTGRAPLTAGEFARLVGRA